MLFYILMRTYTSHESLRVLGKVMLLMRHKSSVEPEFSGVQVALKTAVPAVQILGIGSVYITFNLTSCCVAEVLVCCWLDQETAVTANSSLIKLSKIKACI